MGHMEQFEDFSTLQDEFYKTMVEYLGEEIFVTDGSGKILFVNPASIQTIGLPVEQIVGKTAEELQEKGYFSISSTMEVLKQRKQVNVIQKLKDGRVVLATGVPIFDHDQNKIQMVISTSKDVEALNQLLSKMETQDQELQDKNEEIKNLREEMFNNEGFISIEDSMLEIKSLIMRIAPLNISTLVEGETGVGKEVVVRSIHRFSSRKNNPFIKINCGIIPENLIESELFGYEKGSFTGALNEGKKGKVEQADGGTLFLDEIGELPLNMQVKLLDFLQDGTFTRVGGTSKLKVDARIIAATNRDLKEMCNKGLFRQDLYYRLNVIPIKIPPLRNRMRDIEVLSKYFISCYNSKYKCSKKLENGITNILLSYDWPGNVRELEHVMERAFIMTDGDIITGETLQNILYENYDSQLSSRVICMGIMPLKEAKREIERQLISKALNIYKSTYKVADILRINQSTVVKIMQRHKE